MYFYVQPAYCNYACAQTIITNCYGSMKHAIIKRLRRFTINMIKVCKKKKVGGGDKEPQITEGRAVNIA